MSFLDQSHVRSRRRRALGRRLSARRRRCGSASPGCRARARRCSSLRWSTICCAQARLPVLAAAAEGRIARAQLDPQPDDAVPRFPYEEHLAALSGPGRPLAAIDAAHLAAAAAHRIRARRRLEPGAGAARPRHRRLSRRVAARPDAARQELRALVERDDRGEPRARRARALAGAWLAHLDGLDPQAPFDEDTARAAATSVHRISARRARRRLCALDPAARPFPDAGRSRRLAGADLRAAAGRGERRAGGGIARRDDAAALRGL